jgi:phage shock protein C
VIGGLAEKFGWETRPVRILAGLVGALTLPLGALPVLLPYAVLWAVTRSHGPKTPSQPLRRSRSNARVAGVLAGVAERLEIKPGVVRTLYAGLTVLTGVLPGVVAYLVLWAKTPLANAGADVDVTPP